MITLTRPIIGIEHRTALEVFDIMCDRFRSAHPLPSPVMSSGLGSLQAEERPCVPGETEAGAVVGETGWLIEAFDTKANAYKAEWWAINDAIAPDGCGWTKDSTIALRFAREVDALAYIDDIGWTEARPTEHQWCSTTAASPALGRDEGEAGVTQSPPIVSGVREADAVALLREMFEDGPVHVALAGNPIVCNDLERRVRTLLNAFRGSGQAEWHGFPIKENPNVPPGLVVFKAGGSGHE